MTLLKNEIDLRALPDLYTHMDGTAVTPESWETRRAELRKILAEHEYGYAPGGKLSNELDDPSAVTCRETQKPDTNMCAGKVTGKSFDVVFPTPMGEFSFPVRFFRPKHSAFGDRMPLVIHINFRPLIPDRLFPLEEITDQGYAAIQVYYEDITSDNGDYTNGLAGHYPEFGTEEGSRTPTAWGKIRMWAYALSRLMDVLQRRDDIATDKIFVAGHSRLGKTALVTAAFDDRFAGAVSNDSGCSGAAITRDKIGETVEVISRVFPFWFCPSYRQYADREYAMPFDQHFLTALIAPRALCIGSAWEDSWADPAREFLNAAIIAQLNHFLETGVIPDLACLTQDNGLPLDRYPNADETFLLGGGNVHYHCRPGTHYFSREDWNRYLSYFEQRFLHRT